MMYSCLLIIMHVSKVYIRERQKETETGTEDKGRGGREEQQA